MSNNTCTIDVNQLRVGLYIHLDLGWMDHPFTLSNFKLNDEDQIQKIKKIGLKTLRYDPKRSDCAPLPEVKPKLTLVQSKAEELVEAEAVVASIPEEVAPVVGHEATALRKQLHHAIDESEKKFVIASDTVKNIQRKYPNLAQSMPRTSHTIG